MWDDIDLELQPRRASILGISCIRPTIAHVNDYIIRWVQGYCFQPQSTGAHRLIQFQPFIHLSIILFLLETKIMATKFDFVVVGGKRTSLIQIQPAGMYQ